MAFFTGEHECKLDAKGRLVLPSRLKSVLPEASKKNMIIRKLYYSINNLNQKK